MSFRLVLLPSPGLPANLLLIYVLGIGGCLLGSLALLALPPSLGRARRYATGLASCLGGLSGAAALLDKPRGLWLPGLAVAGAWLLGQLACRPPFANLLRNTARALRRPGAQLALLLAASPLAVMSLLLPPETDVPVRRPARALAQRGQLAPPSVVFQYARTDLGTPVTVLAITPWQEDSLPGLEQQFVGELAENHQLICTATADPSYNCHGWVFAGGRFCLDGSDVGRILNENGYRPVDAPQPGDLAIYRHGDEVTHTALVRAVNENGLVLVESKWGQLGRYIHPADKLTFGHPPAYYRSSRQGHLLKGLGKGFTAAASGRPAPTAHWQ